MFDMNMKYDEYGDDSEREEHRLQRKSKRFKHSYPEMAPTLADPDRANAGSTRGNEEFKPSFTGSKHERQWIMEYLGLFRISNVTAFVRGGRGCASTVCEQ